MDPIHQFEIHPIFGTGAFAFTNSALYMAITVAVIVAFLLLSTQRRAIVPGRWQSLAEMCYEFTASTVRQSAGNDGMRFFPFVFSIFMFVLVANLIGLIPYTFSTTSQIVVTGALSLLVIAVVIVYGFAKHGLHFLKLFVPHGIPVFLLPLVVAIEIISFLSRPVSLSVRLFANMLAGHITIKVFAGFVVQLAAAFGALGWALAVLPLGMTIALSALELLVAVLQAYVFAILTCIYLNDALHPTH